MFGLFTQKFLVMFISDKRYSVVGKGTKISVRLSSSLVLSCFQVDSRVVILFYSLMLAALSEYTWLGLSWQRTGLSLLSRHYCSVELPSTLVGTCCFVLLPHHKLDCLPCCFYGRPHKQTPNTSSWCQWCGVWEKAYGRRSQTVRLSFYCIKLKQYYYVVYIYVKRFANDIVRQNVAYSYSIVLISLPSGVWVFQITAISQLPVRQWF